MNFRTRSSSLFLGAAVLALGACESPVATDLPSEFTPGISALYSGSLDVNEVWFQGFETDIVDWATPTRVASGTGGIASATGGFHSQMNSGGFSRFGAYSDVWPGAWIAEIAVYLDPNWSIGTGFDFSVAANGSDNLHQRDFIFHVGRVADGRLLVNADNNTYGGGVPNQFVLMGGTPYAVTTAGWYTFQHIFYEDGGVLAVDMNLIDAQGNVLLTITLSNASDTIGPTGEVGGNRYAWFIFSNVPGLPADNHRRGIVTVLPGNKDECKNGGWEAFGFRNQGQCIASLQGNAS